MTGKEDLSQEITDLSHSTAGSQEEVDEDPGSPPRSSHALPLKSPSKYQSSLTPGQGIKLVINRQELMYLFTHFFICPLIWQACHQTHQDKEAKATRVRNVFSNATYSPKAIQVKNTALAYIQNSKLFFRGVCKEMGISPNKLRSIMTRSPPLKPKPKRFQDLFSLTANYLDLELTASHHCFILAQRQRRRIAHEHQNCC